MNGIDCRYINPDFERGSGARNTGPFAKEFERMKVIVNTPIFLINGIPVFAAVGIGAQAIPADGSWLVEVVKLGVAGVAIGAMFLITKQALTIMQKDREKMLSFIAENHSSRHRDDKRSDGGF